MLNNVYLSARPRHTRRRPIAALYRWLGLGGLLTVLHLPSVLADEQVDPRRLHQLICASSTELLLNANTSTSRPAAAELGQLLPELKPGLRAAVEQLLNEQLQLQARLNQPPGELDPESRERYNQRFLDTLLLLPLEPATPQKPLVDLPERLDFALAIYVMRAQFGGYRPARESRGSFLNLELDALARGIDHDLLDEQWLTSQEPQDIKLLASARLRWKYIAESMTNYRRKLPAPLNASKQIQRISLDLRQLRSALDS